MVLTNSQYIKLLCKQENDCIKLTHMPKYNDYRMNEQYLNESYNFGSRMYLRKCYFWPLLAFQSMVLSYSNKRQRDLAGYAN
jgi:hypothetical protein